jgi:hypothetical protein
MRTDPLPRAARGVFAVLTSLVVLGCQAAAPRGSAVAPASSQAASGATATPAAGASAVPAGSAAIAADPAWLLVGRRGASGLELVLSTTGEVAMDLPAGSPSKTWGNLVTTTADGSTTLVRDLVVQPGFGGPEVRVPGRWRLPTIGLDPIPAGTSLDGSTIALVEGDYDPAAAVTRFAILEHHLLDAVSTVADAPLRLVRVIELRGAFDYDALSPDGRILYVVEHLDAAAGGHYQVRAVDVPTGVMRDAVVVDKGNPDERMAGTPIAQVRRADGAVLTLYRGPEHPFVHLLNSTDAWAICIDLQAGSAADAGAASDWGLAPSPDGSAVFAVNASLGLAVDIDPTGLAVRRSASIGATAAAPFTLAKFGHGDVGPIGRRLVAAPDGATLFAAGPDGIVAIRTRDLVTVRHDLAGSAVESVGVTPDGRSLFALLGDGSISGLETATGRPLGVVPGGPFDRLLAVAPW